MSEETEQQLPDRYVLESEADTVLKIIDRQQDGRAVETYSIRHTVGALRRLAELNRRAAIGMADPLSEPLTPRRFLSHTLPAKAAEQRSETLSALLLEAWEVVDQSLNLLKQDAEILSRATKAVVKIEAELAELNRAIPLKPLAVSRPQPY